ncbi:MAG: class I SAM-dependent methyltransferase [Oscillospiraceae bacterium]|nr:class I SAM-dependent methyltransferase [Oscillospiraceae bacterium]
MRLGEGWLDYELIDTSAGRRLERWGDYLLIRPDPQVIWKSEEKHEGWREADAVYHRALKGGGSWEFKRSLPAEWTVSWGGELELFVTPTGFKHTGVFPEQAANWRLYRELIAAARREVRVLNLFGYTGAASLVCLKAGASVCHVDASKGMVALAKRNASLNSLESAPIRYIVDDCLKFVRREARRGRRYEAIIMDPPSYGRGPSGELWRLEDNIFELVCECRALLSEKPLFFALNSYTTGLAPSAAGCVVAEALKELKPTIRSDEIGLPVSESGLALPCGATSLATF